MTKSIASCTSQYSNIVLKGDFDSEWDDVCIQSFYEVCRLKSPIKKPTCYKNPDNPSCADLIITKNTLGFQNSCDKQTIFYVCKTHVQERLDYLIFRKWMSLL